MALVQTTRETADNRSCSIALCTWHNPEEWSRTVNAGNITSSWHSKLRCLWLGGDAQGTKPTVLVYTTSNYIAASTHKGAMELFQCCHGDEMRRVCTIPLRCATDMDTRRQINCIRLRPQASQSKVTIQLMDWVQLSYLAFKWFDTREVRPPAWCVMCRVDERYILIYIQYVSLCLCTDLSYVPLYTCCSNKSNMKADEAVASSVDGWQSRRNNCWSYTISHSCALVAASFPYSLRPGRQCLSTRNAVLTQHVPQLLP